MIDTVLCLRDELLRLATAHDPERASEEWAGTWKLIDRTSEPALNPPPTGRADPVRSGAADERRLPVCPRCRGTEFRHVELAELLRLVYGYDAEDCLHIERSGRRQLRVRLRRAALRLGCDTRFELPAEIEFI